MENDGTAKDKVMYVMDETKVGTAFSLANGKPWRIQTICAIFLNVQAEAYLKES